MDKDKSRLGVKFLKIAGILVLIAGCKKSDALLDLGHKKELTEGNYRVGVDLAVGEFMAQSAGVDSEIRIYDQGQMVVQEIIVKDQWQEGSEDLLLNLKMDEEVEIISSENIELIEITPCGCK